MTADSSSSAAVVEAAARSRRSSAPEQTRDGRPSKASSRRAPEVLHHSARIKRGRQVQCQKTRVQETNLGPHKGRRTKRRQLFRHKLAPFWRLGVTNCGWVQFSHEMAHLEHTNQKFPRCAGLGQERFAPSSPKSAPPFLNLRPEGACR